MTVLTRHPANGGTAPFDNDDHHASLHELIRKLVIHVVGTRDSVIRADPEFSHEEIIVDTSFDGVRYLIVRMPSCTSALVSLSPREREIARMVARGYPNKTIAGVLNISSWTVCTHIRRIFAKLGVASRAAMVARFLEESRIWERQPSGKSRTPPNATSSATPLRPAAAIDPRRNEPRRNAPERTLARSEDK
jgi:DNA-binding CsgD family transcriptional regulator